MIIFCHNGSLTLSALAVSKNMASKQTQLHELVQENVDPIKV